MRRRMSSWIASSVPHRMPRKVLRLLPRVLLVILIAPLLLQILIAYIIGDDARLLPPALQRAQNLLIVTAHPDDECLFFAPSILGVLDRNPDTVGGLLVLSTGNNYGAGEERILELKGSCGALGIDPARCVALDRPEIQDSPTEWWDQDVIEKIVREYVQKWSVDVIITFDQGGISGHINHRAVSAAISKYASTDVHSPATFLVSTTMLPRKYTFLVDLPLTALPFCWRILRALVSSSSSSVADESYGDKAIVANTWHRYSQTRRAFRFHNSQYSWDRHLYLIVSRYVWFNDLRRVDQQPT